VSARSGRGLGPAPRGVIPRGARPSRKVQRGKLGIASLEEVAAEPDPVIRGPARAAR